MPTHCPNCNYDLTANACEDAEVCPECDWDLWADEDKDNDDD